MAKQQQQTGLAPSVFSKYMGQMQGAWDKGKSTAREGTKALGLGEFFCRLVNLYFKEVDIKKDQKVVGKALGAVGKLTVVVGDNSGSSCWVDWRFYTDEHATQEERFQRFQKDLVKLGMDDVENVSEQDLPARCAALSKATPGVKVRRYNDRNGNVDQNGNLIIRTFLVGFVDEESLVGMGAVPKRGASGNGGQNMGGAAIEEPSEAYFHDPSETGQQAPPPAAAAPAAAPQRRPAAAPQTPAPAAPPARPARGQPEPVELDIGGEGASDDAGGNEPPLDGEGEPPLEDDGKIDIGRTVQYKDKKTGAMKVGTVQSHHSSGKAWTIKDNNSTDKAAVKYDDPDLKLVS
jgi:hypothetical protein